MTQTPSVTFAINSLEGGGAERVFCRVIDGVVERLPNICSRLILFDNAPEAHRPSADIKIDRLDCGGGFLTSARKFRAFMANCPPTLCLSFLTRANCANVLAARATGHSSIISERVATSSHFGNSPKAIVLKQFVRLLYPRADRLVAVSEGVARDLVNNFGLPDAKIDIIYNPVDMNQLTKMSLEDPDVRPERKYLVAVGRLQANKNVSMLLTAFASANTRLDLVILGDGPERALLEEMARRLGIGHRVHFLGFLPNPYAIMARATAFVSASNAEGFPNALVEAMSLGLPCIFTNCQSGPAEILAMDAALEIEDMTAVQHGVLTPVNDAVAFARAIEYVNDDAVAEKYGPRALARAADFAPEKILDRYADLIERQIFSRNQSAR